MRQLFFVSLASLVACITHAQTVAQYPIDRSDIISSEPHPETSESWKKASIFPYKIMPQRINNEDFIRPSFDMKGKGFVFTRPANASKQIEVFIQRRDSLGNTYIMRVMARVVSPPPNWNADVFVENSMIIRTRENRIKTIYIVPKPITVWISIVYSGEGNPLDPHNYIEGQPYVILHDHWSTP